MLSATRAAELLARFPEQHLVVVGDLMLDRYVTGAVERISPEAPVPVVHVQEERSVPGGACNVAANIKSLGAEVTLCGVIGEDYFGDEMLRVLAEYGIGTDGISRSPDAVTTVKSRVVADGQQVVRVDREDVSDVQVADSTPFLGTLEEALRTSSGAIIEDYGKGCIHQGLIDIVARSGREQGIPTGFDPKNNYTLNVQGLTLVKPNRPEAFAALQQRDATAHLPVDGDADLIRAAQALLALWQSEFLLLTLGPQGMLVVSADAEPHHVHTRAREVYDVSGAGDTVIATTLLALAGGASPVEAAELANYAAGVVVGKLGTVTCSPDELLAGIC